MNYVRLDELATTTQGGKLGLSGKNFVESGYPAYGAGGINGFLAAAEFDKPAIILSAIGARCGKCFLAEGKWTSLANTRLIFPKDERVDLRFLWYQLNDEARWPRSGAAQPFIRPSDVDAHQVYLPPLNEQKRIVAVLDQAFVALDRVRALAEANLADAEELFEAGLDSLIQKEAAGGNVTSLGAVCSFENGDRGKNYPGRKAFVPSGVPFINAGHIAGGVIDWDNMNYIPEEHFHRLGNGKIRQGDLLFCLRGSLGKFGKVDRPGCGAIASSLVIVRASQEVLPDFIGIYFKSKMCAEMVAEYAGGAAQPNLSAADLKKFKIIVPSREGQNRVIAAHDDLRAATSKVEDGYRKKVAESDHVRQSLLQKAISGGLT